jgi:hypothetical protein
MDIWIVTTLPFGAEMGRIGRGASGGKDHARVAARLIQWHLPPEMIEGQASRIQYGLSLTPVLVPTSHLPHGPCTSEPCMLTADQSRGGVQQKTFACLTQPNGKISNRVQNWIVEKIWSSTKVSGRSPGLSQISILRVDCSLSSLIVKLIKSPHLPSNTFQYHWQKERKDE